MSQNNNILGGHLNTINDSSNCTVINGVNNQIRGANNVHVLGDNISVLGANHVNGSADNDDTFYVGCQNGIYVRGKIVAIGDIQSEGDIIAYASSDERLKDNIVPIDRCLDKILSLDAIKFDWSELQQTYSGHDIGLIAQQVKEVAPEIVEEREDGYLAMKYEKLIPLLVGATQEQDRQIEELEGKIGDLVDGVIE